MANVLSRALTRLLRPAIESRQAGRSLARAYEAAGGRRFERQPAFGRYATETANAVARVRDRTRHQVANDPIAANAVAIYRDSTVGAGITAASMHPDAEVRKRLDTYFTAALPGFPALQAEVVTAMVRDGEAVIALKTDDFGRLDPLHIPAEQLAESETRDLGNGRCIIAGVEFDADGRVPALWITPTPPANAFGVWAPPVRVDSADILHVFRRDGAGQARGISWFAPVLLNLNEFSQLMDALLVGVKIAAMHAGIVIDPTGNAAAVNPVDAVENGSIFEAGLEPGTLRILPSGYDIKFSTPQQAQQSIEFAALSIRVIAAGLQLPEFMLSGDMRGANYSSMRSALVQFRQHLEAIQHLILVPQFLLPVWKRVITLGVLSGELDFSDFEQNADQYFAVEFYPPPLPWVDPQKDADAVATQIAAGLKSRRQAVAELGYSIEALDAEIAADKARENTLGLAFRAAGRIERTRVTKHDEKGRIIEAEREAV